MKIKKEIATIDYGSEKRTARIVEKKYKAGDYVIVQGKLVIEKVPKKSAERWIKTLKKL